MKSLLFLILASQAASAHITYGGREFGVLQGGTVGETKGPLMAGITGDFGWAASTDANYGDSHKTRAFSFTLANAGAVTISVQANDAGFLPGFSIYSGLSHIPPEAPAHDGTALSLLYLASLTGPAKVGALVGLGDWAIGNDDVYNVPADAGSGIAVPASLRLFTYMGNAADGTAANYGNAPGIAGDGIADGFVSATFNLPAGDYSLFVGGANLAGEALANSTRYGADVTLTTVPEVSSLWLACAGLALAARRRRSGF